jgi:thiol:disulfide interchange protein DsbD
MNPLFRFFAACSLLLVSSLLFAQDSATVYNWNVSSRKLAEGRYEIRFSTPGAKGWQLYAPNQTLSEVATATLSFPDSAIVLSGVIEDSGSVETVESAIFEGATVKLYEQPSTWRQVVTIKGAVPALLQGSLAYFYGKGDEFYPGELPFSVALEGGVASTTRTLISSIDVKNPVNSCGDDEAAGKSLASIFLLGLVGGLIALVTPCVFPLIPLTVSFLQKSQAPESGALQMPCFMACVFLVSTCCLVCRFTCSIKPILRY